MKKNPYVLTIAGSDPCGGAGIQCDLKTFSGFGVDGGAVITALTVQNSTGVIESIPIDSDLVGRQIAGILSDLSPSAIKIGMLGSRETTVAVARALRGFAAPIVLDPVMASKNGADLLSDDALEALLTELIPRCALITPNIPEAIRLCGLNHGMKTETEVLKQAISGRIKVPVLLKGGHDDGPDCIDWLLSKEDWIPFSSGRLIGGIARGTGCCLSAGIAAALAHGLHLEEGIRAARKYLRAALANAQQTGKGYRFLSHHEGALSLDEA